MPVVESGLRPGTSMAFKEWAVVCAALESGRQNLLIRKGGIHENGDRFAWEHQSFWLFPTKFHQQPNVVRESAADLWTTVQTTIPPENQVRIELYAVIEERTWIEREADLSRLDGLHILTPATLSQRFHYRCPGLWVGWVRIFRSPVPQTLQNQPEFAGCKSWVDLRTTLPTSQLQPVIPDEAHSSVVLERERLISDLA